MRQEVQPVWEQKRGISFKSAQKDLASNRSPRQNQGLPMYDILAEANASTCGGSHLTRREMLQVGALSAVGLSLPQLLAAEERNAVRPGHKDKACIMIFNLGAPSHVDLWDMKPDAPSAVLSNPFARNHPTSTSPRFCRCMQRSPTSFHWLDRYTMEVRPCTTRVGRSCRRDVGFQVACKRLIPVQWRVIFWDEKPTFLHSWFSPS